MNIGRVLKYLLTGVIVGAVLFFAGFGVVNMLKKDTVEPPVVQQPVITRDTTTTAVSEAPTVEVTPPAINVAEGTSSSPIKIKPLGASADDANSTAEGESTAEPEPVFGTLTLKAINSTNQQPLKADFLIENDAGAAIAQVKSTESTTLSFPAGSYKITVNQGTNKIVRYLGVKDGQNGSETFEIDAPVLDGEPAVAAAPVGADTPVTITSAPAATDANAPVIVGETPATNVAAQTPAATDTQTTTATEASTETAQVATEATPATTESTATTDIASSESTTIEAQSDTSNASTTVTATNQQAATGNAQGGVGGLRVSALTQVGNRPMSASFYIQRLNGENVANIKNVTTHQFNLPAGSYRITAREGTARMVKQIEVVASRGLHEIFKLPTVAGSAPSTAPAATPSNTTQAAAPVNTAPVTPVATAPSTAPATAETDTSQETGRLELFSRDAATNKPIRSNFYIQSPQGALITSKTYVESIGYRLPAKQYKVTVRATGYKNKVVTLNVRKDQARRETFQMELVAPPVPAPAPAAVVTPPVSNVNTAAPAAVQAVRQAPPRPQPRANRGGLQVNIVSPQGAPLQADIMVLRRNGTPVKRAINAATANFDLAPRNFVLRVRHAGFVTNQQINIIPGKLAIKTITFDLNTGFRQ